MLCRRVRQSEEWVTLWVGVGYPSNLFLAVQLMVCVPCQMMVVRVNQSMAFWVAVLRILEDCRYLTEDYLKRGRQNHGRRLALLSAE